MAASPTDDPDHAGHLSYLCLVLLARFERVGDVADLNAAIVAGRTAVAATPADHPDRAGYLSNVGLALEARFRRTGEVTDLDEAVRMGRAAVAATQGRRLILGTGCVTPVVASRANLRAARESVL